jgi:hypothetical protein
VLPAQARGDLLGGLGTAVQRHHDGATKIGLKI